MGTPRGPLGQGRPARAGHGPGRASSSTWIGSSGWAAQFALPLPSGGAAGGFPAATSARPARRSMTGSRIPTLAADPPRPSAGRATPAAMTSDIPCRAAAPAKGSPVPRPGCARPARRSCARCHARARSPLAWLGRSVPWPRTPSVGLTPGIAAGPGSLALAVRSRSLAQHPFTRGAPPPPSRRGADPCYPSKAVAGPQWEDVSHRLLQPILSTCTRGPAGLPASSTPRGASSARVEIRLTPSLQLPPRIDALLPEGSAGSGPALRRGRPLRPTTALSTRLLPPPVTRRDCPCEQLSRPRTASASPSSKGAASATRSGFVGSLPLAIRFRRSRGGSSRPLQSPRLPSTNHERPGSPLAPPEVSLLRGGCGQPRVSRRATGRDARIQGPAGASRPASSSPTIPVAGKLFPASARRGHLLSRARVPLRLEQPDRNVRPACGGRSRAPRVRAASPAPPRRRTRSAHPRCLPSRSSPGRSQVLHRLSPACGFLVRCLFYRRDLVRKDVLTMSWRLGSWVVIGRSHTLGPQHPSRFLRWAVSSFAAQMFRRTSEDENLVFDPDVQPKNRRIDPRRRSLCYPQASPQIPYRMTSGIRHEPSPEWLHR